MILIYITPTDGNSNYDYTMTNAVAVPAMGPKAVTT